MTFSSNVRRPPFRGLEGAPARHCLPSQASVTDILEEDSVGKVIISATSSCSGLDTRSEGKLWFESGRRACEDGILKARASAPALSDNEVAFTLLPANREVAAEDNLSVSWREILA